MPFYFIISLAVSIVLASSIFALLVNRLQVNWTRQNKIGISYLLPVFITVIFAFVIYLDTQPKVLDLVNLVQGNTKIIEVQGSEIIDRGNNLRIDDDVYLASPFIDEVSDDQTYRLTYLPNSKIIVSQENVVTLPTLEEVPLRDQSEDNSNIIFEETEDEEIVE